MLAEAALALVVLVLAVWLAADLVGQVRQRRRCDQFIADLHEFSAAFQRYARLPKAALPARAHEGALPPAVVALLKETNWAKGSPFGGTYEWLPPPPIPAAPGASAVAPRSGGANTTKMTASPAASAPAAKAAEKAEAAAPATNVVAGAGATTRAPAALGAITVTAYAPNWPLTLTAADLLRIDRRIDDGNLATGRFRTGFNGWPVYEMVGK